MDRRLMLMEVRSCSEVSGFKSQVSSWEIEEAFNLKPETLNLKLND